MAQNFGAKAGKVEFGDGTSVSVGGRAEKTQKKWLFLGKWYKPWTWFNWAKVWLIKEFKMLEVSLVDVPPDPNCAIHFDEAKRSAEEEQEVLRAARDHKLDGNVEVGEVVRDDRGRIVMYGMLKRENKNGDVFAVGPACNQYPAEDTISGMKAKLVALLEERDYRTYRLPKGPKEIFYQKMVGKLRELKGCLWTPATAEQAIHLVQEALAEMENEDRYPPGYNKQQVTNSMWPLYQVGMLVVCEERPWWTEERGHHTVVDVIVSRLTAVQRNPDQAFHRDQLGEPYEAEEEDDG